MESNQIIIPFILTLLAGLSTVAGSLVFLFFTTFKKSYLGFFLGLSAGVMIYLSFVELLPYATRGVGFVNSSLFFFLGVGAMAIIDFFLPHHYLQEKIGGKHFLQGKMLSTGLMVLLGLTIHNFPEGAAVFLSSVTDIKLGVLLALAIAVHNIPEGIAVAVPIYEVTRNKAKAIKLALVSGMAEPLGAVFAYFILKPYLNQNILSYIFAVVAGVMVYISFDELLPACYQDEHGHQAILGIITGMVLVSLSLVFL